MAATDRLTEPNSLSALQALVVVAHPDDEILWCGGLILSHPHRHWRVLSLCRGDDPDRQPRFFRSMARLGASGKIDSLDDGPAQRPLSQEEVENTIRCHLGNETFDLVLTHGPRGEYTRHLRHEEVSKAVRSLWEQKIIRSKELRLFAYEDEGRRHLPSAAPGAHRVDILSDAIWKEKRDIIQTIYGFKEDSWEYRTTPETEAFWCFQDVGVLRAWTEGQIASSRLPGR